MNSTISELRETFLNQCEIAGDRFATCDKMQIPVMPLKGQPLKHGLVHLVAYFGEDSATGEEFISGFKINFRPLVADDQYEEFYSQAMAISKIIDALN